MHVLGLLLLGCGSGGAPQEGNSTDRLVDDLGFYELPLAEPDAPAGFVDFYMGPEVLVEYAATGTFRPSEEKGYSMIRLPESGVDDALRSGEPVTYALCNDSLGIVLFHQTVADVYHAPSPEQVENCTPWVQKYEGRMTIE